MVKLLCHLQYKLQTPALRVAPLSLWGSSFIWGVTLVSEFLSPSLLLVWDLVRDIYNIDHPNFRLRKQSKG